MLSEYSRVNWQDSDSTATPINAENLNHMDAQIEAATNAIRSDVTAALASKADKSTTVAGIDLQDNITAEELKAALNVPVVDSALSSTSDNPVKNKVIYSALNNKANSNDVTKTSDIGVGSNDELIKANNSGVLGRSGYSIDGNSSHITTTATTKVPTANAVAEKLAEKADADHTHSQYLTNHQDITGKVDKTATIAGVDLQDNISAAELRTALSVPAKTSDLTNDSGFMPMIDVNSLSSCTENGVLYRVKEINDTYLILNNKPEAVMGAVWAQFRFRDDGIAYRISEYSNGDWGAFDSFGFFEENINKASSITDDNKTSIAYYPTIKAVVDYISAQGFLTSHQDISGKYEKPSGGIPKTDLASAVQTSLGKADSSVQPADVYLKSQLSTKTLSVTDGSTTTNYSVLVVNSQ